MEKPTTRQVLQELFDTIEEHAKKAESKPGEYDPVCEARASGLRLVQAMIVGLENKYGIYD